jgi:hypothetical protein
MLSVLEEDAANRDSAQKIGVAMDIMEYSPESCLAFIKKNLPKANPSALTFVFKKYSNSCSFENLLKIVSMIEYKHIGYISTLIARSEELKEHKLTAAFFKLLDNGDYEMLHDYNFLENADEFFEKIEDESWIWYLKRFFKQLNNGLAKLQISSFDSRYLAIAGHLARLNELEPVVASRILYNLKITNHPDLHHIIHIAPVHAYGQSKTYKDKLLNHIFTAKEDYNLFITKRKLQAYLKWPTYEGEAEEQYGNELSKRIQSLKHYQLYPLIELVSGIPEIYPKFNHEKLGIKILNSAISKITQELPKIAPSPIPMILKAFYRNANNVPVEFYKSIFDIFDEKFDEASDYSKNDIVRCMAFNGLRLESSVDKIVNDMYDNPSNYIPGNYLSAIESLSDLNILKYRERFVQESIQRLPASFNTREFSKEHTYIRWLWSLIYMKVEPEVLESYAKLYNPDPVLPTFLFKKLLAYKYFEVNNIPFGHKEERHNLQKRLQPFMSFGFLPHWFKELESKFPGDLKLHTFVDGNYIPALHTPTQTAIWPVSHLVEIYKQKELKGAFIMHKKFIEESGMKLSMPSGYILGDMSKDEILNSEYESSR